MRFLVLAVLVASCTSNDDDNIECAFNDQFLQSTDTDNASLFQTTATAVGGKQKLAGIARTCGVKSTFELRIASLHDPSLATVKIFNGIAVLTGVAEGMTYLDATGTQYGSEVQVSVAAIDHVTIPSIATGAPYVAIQLLDRNDQPVVDDTLTVTGALSLGDRWDHLAIGSAAPGDYALTIHAGATDWPVTVTVTP